MKKLNGKEIRKNTFNIAFKKGLKVWFLLVSVCFIYSFVGVSDPEQTSFINISDSFLKLDTTYTPDNVQVINDYIVHTGILEKIPLIPSGFMTNILNGLFKSYSWFINLLAANFAYFQRNPGEVFASLIIVAFVSLLIRIFIQNAFIIGKARYTMENRFEKEVSIKRIFAPFHKEYIINIIWVQLRYYISLTLWLPTIIGYIYKLYQYSMIKYLLAENPKITWKDAKKMSIQMTKGYKWQMFKIELSCFYIYLLKLIPVVGLLVSLPYEETLYTEFYFKLRENYKKNKDIFIEDAFNDKIYPESKKKNYLLGDVVLSPKEIRKNIETDIKRLKGSYNIYDYIFFFFVFSIIGYIWEVGLHFAKHFEFVNRGTMYGPWLPIYGCGGVLIILLLDRFKTKKFKLFFSAVGLCAVLEYISSWFLEFFYNSSYWDYKQMFMNVNGRICFVGLLAFGLGGLAGVYLVAPRLSLFLDKLGKNKTKLLCITLVSLFIIDLICILIFGLNTGSGVGNTF